MLNKRTARMRACTRGGDQRVWPAYLVAACCGRSLAFIHHGQSHPAQSFLFPLGPPGSSQIPQLRSALQIQHSLSTNCVPRTRLYAGDTAPSRPQEAQCHPGDSSGWGLVEPSGEVAVTQPWPPVAPASIHLSSQGFTPNSRDKSARRP